MVASISNRYVHRKVADASRKGCNVCLKPTTSVLITELQEDFFYVCPSHLRDANFCTPDQAALDAIQELEKKRVIQEWEERRRKKEREGAEKEKEKEKEGEAEAEGGGGKSDDIKGGESKEDKKAADGAKSGADQDKDPGQGKPDTRPEDRPETSAPEPRVFNLKPAFFNTRLSLKRNADAQKRSLELLKKPNLFPSVPKNAPGQ